MVPKHTPVVAWQCADLARLDSISQNSGPCIFLVGGGGAPQRHLERGREIAVIIFLCSGEQWRGIGVVAAHALCVTYLPAHRVGRDSAPYPPL